MCHLLCVNFRRPTKRETLFGPNVLTLKQNKTIGGGGGGGRAFAPSQRHNCRVEFSIILCNCIFLSLDFKAVIDNSVRCRSVYCLSGPLLKTILIDSMI